MLLGNAGHLLSAIASAFSPNFAVFAICRFSIAFCNILACLSAYVLRKNDHMTFDLSHNPDLKAMHAIFIFFLALEFFGPKYRAAVGLFCQLSFTVGFAMLPLFAFFFRDFTHLQIVFALPVLLSVSYVW